MTRERARDPADGARCQLTPNLIDRRVKRGTTVNDLRETRLARRHQLIRFFDGRTKRLLHKQVKAAFEHSQASFGVQGVRKRDDHCMQLIIIEQARPVRRKAGHIKALTEQTQSALCSPADMRHTHAFDFRDLRQMAERGDASGAEDADTNH